MFLTEYNRLSLDRTEMQLNRSLNLETSKSSQANGGRLCTRTLWT